MKYFLGLLSSSLLGAAGALTALYYNPLNLPRPTAPRAAGWELSYDFPTADTIALTHAGRQSLPQVPQGVARLWEVAIEDLVLSALMLEDAGGTAQAFASRVSVPSTETNLLLRGVVVADYWLITVPGRGSLYVDAHNNVWPLFKDAFIPVTHLRRAWRGPATYDVTVGPGRRASAEVVGVTGSFAGASGTARETYTLERFSAMHGIEALRGTLAIELDEPRTNAVADSNEAELAAQ